MKSVPKGCCFSSSRWRCGIGMSTRPRYLTSPPFVRVRRARHVHYLSSPRERRGRGTRMRRWPPPAPPSGHPRRRLGGRLSRPWSPVRLKGERDSKEAIVHILLSIKNTSGPARSRRVATNERGGFPDPNPRRRVPPGKDPHGPHLTSSTTQVAARTPAPCHYPDAHSSSPYRVSLDIL